MKPETPSNPKDSMILKSPMPLNLPECFSEDERWDPIPGSTGHQAEESASEEEDEDGQGESAQLFEEGVCEAAHDQMLQAAIAAWETRLSDS